MTRLQFAMIVGCDVKWVENAARLLGRTFTYTPAEARWLSLVHIFNQRVGLTLARSAMLAEEALRHGTDAGRVVVGIDGETGAGVSIDLARFHSSHAAALSTALEFGGERRRGRPRAPIGRKAATLEKSAAYGVDIDLLREGLRLSRRERLEHLDQNAAFITALHSSERR